MRLNVLKRKELGAFAQHETRAAVVVTTTKPALLLLSARAARAASAAAGAAAAAAATTAKVGEAKPAASQELERPIATQRSATAARNELAVERAYAAVIDRDKRDDPGAVSFPR